MVKAQAILLRFAKGFVSGGIASVIATLSVAVPTGSYQDIKVLGFSLLIAFLSGGLLAIEKAINWTDAPQGQ